MRGVQPQKAREGKRGEGRAATEGEGAVEGSVWGTRTSKRGHTMRGEVRAGRHLWRRLLGGDAVPGLGLGLGLGRRAYDAGRGAGREAGGPYWSRGTWLGVGLSVWGWGWGWG